MDNTKLPPGESADHAETVQKVESTVVNEPCTCNLIHMSSHNALCRHCGEKPAAELNSKANDREIPSR